MKLPNFSLRRGLLNLLALGLIFCGFFIAERSVLLSILWVVAILAGQRWIGKALGLEEPHFVAKSSILLAGYIIVVAFAQFEH